MFSRLVFVIAHLLGSVIAVLEGCSIVMEIYCIFQKFVFTVDNLIETKKHSA
jgi:hypothetical protein